MLFSPPRILRLLSGDSVNTFGFRAYDWERTMAVLFLTSARTDLQCKLFGACQTAAMDYQTKPTLWLPKTTLGIACTRFKAKEHNCT